LDKIHIESNEALKPQLPSQINSKTRATQKPEQANQMPQKKTHLHSSPAKPIYACVMRKKEKQEEKSKRKQCTQK